MSTGGRGGDDRRARGTGRKGGDSRSARGAPRLFPTHLEPGERRVYAAVALFYLATTVALVWPVYARFGSIRPMVLGMPFSLVYVVLWVLASFLVLLALFLWEGRRGDRPRPDGDGGSGGGAQSGGRGGPAGSGRPRREA